MLLRKLRNFFLKLVALLLILLASMSALVETETGSHWVVNALAGLVNVQIGPMRGNLRQGLDISSVDYQQGEQVFHAEQVSFRWRPIDLFYSALMIDALSAQRISLQVPVAPAEQPAAAPFSAWPTLRLPVRVQLRNLDLRHIRYQQGDLLLQWEALSGDLSLGTFNLRYRDLHVIHKDYQLRLTGRTSLDYPYTSDAELHWQWQQPALADGREGLLYRGVSQLTGSLPALQVANTLNSPVQLTAQVTGALVNKQRELTLVPDLSLVAEWPVQSLPSAWWMADKAVPITRGALRAEGNWQAYRGTLEGVMQLPDAPTLALNSDVEGDLQGLQLHSLTIRELSERLSLADAATVATDSAAASTDQVPASTVDDNTSNRAARLRLTGAVRWLPELDWQLAVDAKAFNLAALIDNWPSQLNARFTTHGRRTGAQWQAELRDLLIDGELRGVNVQGSGGVAFIDNTLRSDALALVVGANQLQLKGVLGDDIDLNWNINAPLLHQLDESLSGSVISKGELRGHRTRPRISVSASANQFVWGAYQVDTLAFSLAPGALPAAPLVGPESPGASADAVPIALNPLNLLTGELLQEHYELSLVANRVQLAQQYFSHLTLKGSGSVAKHQLQATVRSPALGRVEMGVNGEYDDYQWQGALSQLAVKLTKVPRWWLTASKPIRIGASGVLLGEQCLTTRTNLTAAVERDSDIEREQLRGEWQPNQSPVAIRRIDQLVNQTPLPASSIEKYSLPRLCIQGDWGTTSGVRLDAQLDSVPLRQFLSLFKTEVYFAGVMDGSVTLRSPDLSLAATRASVDITTRNAELRYQHPGGVTDLYPWNDFALRAQLQNAQLTARSGLEWVGFGRMEVDGLLDLQKQTINRARLTLGFHNIAPLETLLPFTNDVSGELTGELLAGGSFSAPYLLGDINLRNGGANMTRLGLNLTALQMHIHSTQAGTISVRSEAQSGDGRMTLLGDLQGFGTPAWKAEASIKGSDFRVISLPELKANLSPNIKVSADASAMHLTGEAEIPWARANIKSLPPSATQVSADVIIVDETAQKRSGTPFNIYSNLNLSLGKDVRFKGFGLSSKLNGRLNLLQEAHRSFFTNGFVSVSEGSYKAYGQTLTIERGRLAFQGPYDNPGLDIRATRQIRDSDSTKVGLDIDGTLQRPKAKVFSSPSRSDSEAMMMLLTGKPIKEASDADASLLLSAMSGLGMDSGGSITAEINRFFGVDQLEVKADAGIEQSQLWVGKYLTPKLLVRYVVGIFDQAFSFGIEYQLTDSFRIEAESGETKSVDVIYKIER